MNRIGDNLVCTGSNKKIVDAFIRYGVDFVLIGGLAVAWYCQRQADDMDLVVKPTAENSEKVAAALSSIGLSDFRKEAFANLGTQAVIKGEFYADLLTPFPGWPSYEELVKNCTNGKLFNNPVNIPSVSNLISIKSHTISTTNQGKEKHQRDIELLQSVVV